MKCSETVTGLDSSPCEFDRKLPAAGPSEWLVWQLADSTFPTGSFAHSGGLEAAYQHHTVRTAADLAGFLDVALSQLVHGSLPFVHAAFENEKSFSDLDRRCDAFLSNHVANRASRAQGQSFLATAERAFASAALHEFRLKVSESQLPGHAAPVFGRTAKLLEFKACSTARLFVFMQMRGWLSAAVRLNIVGPFEAQHIQHRLTSRAESAAAQFGTVPVDHVAQCAPLLDLWQGTHDRLYSRLFQS